MTDIQEMDESRKSVGDKGWCSFQNVLKILLFFDSLNYFFHRFFHKFLIKTQIHKKRNRIEKPLARLPCKTSF